MTYQEWFEALRKEYGEQLQQMPLPEGALEHLRQMMQRGDEEGLTFMVKLAWQLGAQVGYGAAQYAERPRSNASSVKA